MTCRVSGRALVASTLASAFLGCNQLLDNNPGTAIDSEAGALVEPGTPSTSGEPSQLPGADAGDPSASSGCPAGQQTCFGTCVSMDLWRRARGWGGVAGRPSSRRRASPSPGGSRGGGPDRIGSKEPAGGPGRAGPERAGPSRVRWRAP